MLDTTNLTAVISVNPQASMEASFNLRVVASNDLQAEIQPRVSNMLLSSIAVRAAGTTDLMASIAPRFHTDLPSSITPRVAESIVASIRVNPLAIMEATFDVIQPVPTIVTETPMKDNFVRSGIPRINYGYEEEVIIGNFNGEDYEALYNFDLSFIPNDIRIVKAELRLYNINGVNPVNVDIFETEHDWPEYSTTWANKPATIRKFTSTTLGLADGYENIDLSSKIIDWSLDPSKNISLLVRGTETDKILRSTTKENTSSPRPILYVEYVDKYPKSSGIYKLPCNIVVRRLENESLPASITINSYYMKDKLDASITVPIYPGTPSSITASINVRSGRVEDLQGSITVPIYDGTSDIPCDIYVVALGSNNFPASIKVPIYSGGGTIDASISVRKYNKEYLRASINVPGYSDTSDIPVSIEPRLSDSFVCSIQVRRSSDGDLPASATIRPNTSIEASIFVISGFLAASITVPNKDKKELPASINVSIRYISDIPCYIRVGSPGSYVYIM